MTAWDLEARRWLTVLNEITKTKLDTNTETLAGVNILLTVVGLVLYLNSLLFASVN